MASAKKAETKKIGVAVTGLGVILSLLGIVLFHRRLILLGNILFFSGVTLTIGLKPAMHFFSRCRNVKGTISFCTGFFLILVGWPIIGIIAEGYGFIALFRGFWPTLAIFLPRLPIIGWVFRQHFAFQLLDRHRCKRVPV